MPKLMLLALLLPAAALAQDDPDDFAVPSATPLEVLPLGGDVQVDVTVEVEGASDTEVQVQTGSGGKFGAATPSPAASPLAVPVAPAPPPAPTPPPAPAPVVETQTTVTTAETEVVQSRTVEASVGVSRAGGERSVTVWVEGSTETTAVDETESLPPFHSATATPNERPLAIPGNAPPPREPAAQRRASRPAPAPVPAPAPAPQVEASNADVLVVDEVRDERRKRVFGVWGGMQGARTRIDGDRSMSGAIDVGFHLGRWFVFSGTLGSINDSYAGGEIGYVGVRHGVVLRPNRRIHPRLDLLWGIATSSEDPSRPFNIAEPRAALELKLGDWGRVEATAGYRVVASAPVPNARLSGPTLGLGMRLGWF